MEINIRSPYFLLSVLFTGRLDIPIIFSEVVLRDEILTQHKLKETLEYLLVFIFQILTSRLSPSRNL